MGNDYKRPKTLDSFTINNIPSQAGNLNLTMCYDNKRLVEVFGEIGKAGSYASIQLTVLCRLLSIILQSKLSRTKIMKKIRLGFFDIDWGLPFEYEKKEYTGHEDFIFKTITKEIATKKYFKKYLAKKTA